MKTFWTILAVILLVFWTSSLKGQWTGIVRLDNNEYDQSETAVAYNPLTPSQLIAAWNDMRLTENNNIESKPGYALSTNGGVNWQTSALVILDSGYTIGFDPSVAFDRHGNAFYCYVAGTPSSLYGPVYVSRTSDFGGQWGHGRVSPAAENQDKPYMTVDNAVGSPFEGRIYVSWTDFSVGNTIRIAYSTNGGTSWSTSVSIASAGSAQDMSAVGTAPTVGKRSDPTTDFVQGAMSAVAPNGDVYVVWMFRQFGAGHTPGSILIRRSTDGGGNFSAPMAVDNDIATLWNQQDFIGPFRPSSMPTIAIDPTTGYIYVAYAHLANGFDISCKRSTDYGNSWQTVSSPTQQTNGDQFFPALAANPSGTIGLLYCDKTASAIVTALVAQSYNGGVSFYSPNSTLGTTDIRVALNTKFSDYIGIAPSSVNDLFAVWAQFPRAEVAISTGRQTNVRPSLRISPGQVNRDNIQL